MKKIYAANTFEKDVQKYWEENKTFIAIEEKNREKYYCLSMLPYPSGKLHMGHVRNYTISDVIARYHRMIGKNVLHPIGWDAFGLPAEEAALKNHTVPEKWTKNNIQYMKYQLKRLGLSYDWNREITTCDPQYYKWEQWFFKKLYKLNLIYKKTALVNWCPKDQTVLANEQVIDGKCWRCQSDTIKKVTPQWFIKITKYADQLLTGLKLLKHWPKKVISMQKNWIGKRKGFEINLNVDQSSEIIKIYIERLDLLFGTTYIAISPLHDLARKTLTENELQHVINKCYTKNNGSKIHYYGKKTSKYAIHPITNKKVPIWIASYINIEYNVDCIMSCPAHNKHDWNFSKKYNIEKKFVILNNSEKKINKISIPNENPGVLFNSDQFNGLRSEQAIQEIFFLLKKKNIIKKKNIYRLQDWSISRQRYWGVPIPVAYYNQNITLVSDDKLPILPPQIKNIKEFKNINKIYQDWSKIKINNILMRKEVDTFDTFMESSWYYVRYTSPNYPGMVNTKAANYWLPVDQYIGGIEHATMHLIYFRFFHKLLYQFKLVNSPEPAKKLLCQGMVLADAFYYINKVGEKIWLKPKEIKIIKKKFTKNKKSIIYNKKKITYAGMVKMSKSKNNGIDPEKMINKYGADTIRLFIMFAAPVESDVVWDETGVKGMHRFLQKIWTMVYNYKYCINNTKKTKQYKIKDVEFKLNQTVIKVSQDIEYRYSFNTAISEIMKFIKFVYNIAIKDDTENLYIKKILNTIIKMLYPFTPHFSFILWKKLKNKEDIDKISWPKYNLNPTIKNNINLIIQINGKKKDILIIPKNKNTDQILHIIQKKSKISNVLKKNNIKKIFYIKNKLINLVI